MLLSNDALARLEAVRISGSLLIEYPQLLDDRDFRIQVTDEVGGVILTVITLVVDG